jgi:hypothetical protein
MIKMKPENQESQSELRKFLSFTISNPKVPLLVWFWGILIKSLTILWLGYCVVVGLMILIEHGPPEPFLIILFQATAATILYFLGDGLCLGEKSAVYGLGALCIVAIIVAIASGRMGLHMQMGLLISSIFLLFVPPLVSGFRNMELLE